MTDYASTEVTTPHVSPDGRPVAPLIGDPDVIQKRGSEIEDLGRKMRESANTLQKVKDRTADNQGKAIDSFRKSIGDSHETLREAADLYEPVGPVIHQYGLKVEDYQGPISDSVTKCCDLWEKYESLPGDKDGRGVGGWFQPDEGSDEAEKQADEDEAKRAAYEEWEHEGNRFDRLVESWETAFTNAADGITDAEAGTIEDSGWDFLDDLSEVLSWVGMGLAIAAIFLTGPVGLIVGGAALAVGVVGLGVDTARYLHGDASFGDLMWSAAGAIPFGKAGTGLLKAAGKSGQVAATADRTAAQAARFGGEIGPGTKYTGDVVTKSVLGKGMDGLARSVTAPMDTGGAVATTAGFANLFGGMADSGILYAGIGKKVGAGSSD